MNKKEYLANRQRSKQGDMDKAGAYVNVAQEAFLEAAKAGKDVFTIESGILTPKQVAKFLSLHNLEFDFWYGNEMGTGKPKFWITVAPWWETARRVISLWLFNKI